MNGYDIQDYLLLKQKCDYNGFYIDLSGKGKIEIKNGKNDNTFGYFDTVREGLCFVCGYEQGLERGKEIINESNR
jgi:hypothetical protein